MVKQTFNQINNQELSARINRSDALPTVLIERSDKERITVGSLDPDTRNVLFNEGGQDKVRPDVPLELLTDAHQAELAERYAGKPLKSELGGTAVSGAVLTSGFIDRVPDHIMSQGSEEPAVEVLPTPQERADALDGQINTLLKGLTEAEQNKLFRYSMYKSNKAEAQRRGDGDLSIAAGMDMGQEYASMSIEAQSIADQYDELLEKLSQARREQ